MLQRSPILRFALEVFEHALESVAADKPRDNKLAVINLAQVAELAIKAALVERNVSIYQKDNKTIGPHDALRQIAALWDIERLACHSRLELLIDERNSIQHRYGSVDSVTLDYHLESVFQLLEELLRREFDIDLKSWVRDTVPEGVWSKIRFVEVSDQAKALPSEASLPDRDAKLDLVDGFSRYESTIRQLMKDATGQPQPRISTLDFCIKTLASLSSPPRDLITALPKVYGLRNRVIHGDADAKEPEVKTALEHLDAVLAALTDAPPDLLRRAVATIRFGVKGAQILSGEEIAQRELATRARSPMLAFAGIGPTASLSSMEEVAVPLTVSFPLNAIRDIASISATVTWDPTILALKSEAPGNWHDTVGRGPASVLVNTNEAHLGKIQIAGFAAVGSREPFVLRNLTFSALKPGGTLVGIAVTAAGDTLGQPVVVGSRDLQITVAA